MGVATDTFKLALSNVKYNLAANAPVGAVGLRRPAGDLVTGPATANNAIVTGASYTFIPVVAAQLTSTSNALGTAKFVETTAGRVLPGWCDHLGDPDAERRHLHRWRDADASAVPAGYTATKPATTGTNAYTFTVTAPATAGRPP